MPELPELLEHPALQPHLASIRNLYNVIELTCNSEKVEELQSLVVSAVYKLIDGDFHTFDHILNQVGMEVNRIVNHQ